MSKKENKEVKVLEDSLEALADNVAVISEIGKMIKKSRLTEYAIVLLIQHCTTGVNQTQIRTVLSALPRLEEEYLKKKK